MPNTSVWNSDFNPASGDITTLSSLLEKTKTLMVINAWVRDYPELMYVGMYLPNMFADWGKLKMWQLSYAEQKQLNFKTIWSLEAQLSVNENEVVWYEAWLYLEESDIRRDNTTASNVILLEAEQFRYFKINDVVVIKPWKGSTTPELQATITATNPATNEITLSASTTCAVWDRIIFLYNLITYWEQIGRWTAAWWVKPVRSYFQTFGESIEFNSNELNQTRLLVDATNYVKERFSVALNSTNNRFAKAFYAARNIAWAQSETTWLDNVITEQHSTFGNAIYNFATLNGWTSYPNTHDGSKEKALKLVQIINEACSAPVYNGWEVPTVFCNYEMITSLSRIKFDMANYFTMEQKEIAFGIQAYTSPFFRWVEFIVSQTLNRLEPNRSVAYMFPKHLVTFKTPQYQSVNEMWALITTKVGWYTVMKMPQYSPDKVKYTAQMRIANIFAWISFKNTYKKIINF